MTRKATTKPIYAGTTKRCCEQCVHYMRGFYKSTQITPGNVCGNKPKKMYGVKPLFPKRKFFYKTEPNWCCEDFKQWIQPTKDEIYGDNN